MKYLREKDKVILRLDKGDEIISCLKKVSEELGIFTASVSGIGATDDLTVGVFNVKKQKYDERKYFGNREINAVMGNITSVDGVPYIHVHVSCTGKDFKVVGGHLIRAIVSLTAEIVIDVIDIKVGRFHDGELNINRLSI